MSVIYLIRHGQASFSKKNYDQLSQLGGTQATILGKALQQRKSQPSLVTGGDMHRHQQTALHCMEAIDPKIEYHRNHHWNEYDHMELIAKHRPDLGSFEQLMQYIIEQEHPKKALHKVLTNAITDWIEDHHDYTLKWSDFKSRVWSSLTSLAARLEKKETAYVFTSGGPITAAMILLLELKDQQFMDLQSRIVNASATKILVGKGRLSLSTYNDYSHLESDPSLITYR